MLRAAISFPGTNWPRATTEGEVISIGRSASNTLCIPDPRVSGIHGQIVAANGVPIYQDLRSRNGSMIVHAGVREAVTPGETSGVPIHAGDQILLGDIETPVVLFVEELEALQPGAGENPERTIVAQRAMATPHWEPKVLSDGATLRTLYELQADLAKLSGRDALLERCAAFVLNTIPEAAQFVVIMRGGPAGPFEPVLKRSRGVQTGAATVPKGIQEHAVRRQEAVLFADLPAEVGTQSVMQSGFASAICAPIVEQGEVTGLILTASRSSPLTERHLDLAALLALHLAALLTRERAVEHLRSASETLKAENLYFRRKEGPDERPLLGKSAIMEDLRRRIAAVAKTETSVFIHGETGTGKELVARAIHAESHRASQFFGAINCGAIPENLIESELFGHAKGAFTGAHQARKGLFLLADKGTLFLDEIGDMPLAMQVKLLRVLQEHEFWPVGGSKPVSVDVRIIAATTRDLQEDVKAGRFREDLFYRIHVFTIEVPPLRVRPDDIEMLAQIFATRLHRKDPASPAAFDATALARLRSYAWPGNVRELENEVTRASVLARPKEVITAADLSPHVAGAVAPAALTVVPTAAASSGGPVYEPGESLKSIMRRLERQVLEAALVANGWNRAQTARALGISRQALMTKLGQFRLRPE